LQVFLLKHLMLQTSSPTASVAATPLASRRNSDTSLAARGESVGCVIVDDLNSFASVQNTSTIDQAAKSAMRTAGRIQWCSRDSEAVVTVSDQSGTILGEPRDAELLEVKMKKKQVECLLDPKAAIPSLREVGSMQQRRDMEKIRGWLKSHPGVTPLAKILSHRIRFSGPVAGGQAWAFVDRDIKMISHSDDPSWVTSENEGSEGAKMIEFPHAVVEIQWDGKQTPAFIHELTQSHFVCSTIREYYQLFYVLTLFLQVERVPGFSMDAHAIAVLYEPKDMLPPVWVRKHLRSPAAKKLTDPAVSSIGEGHSKDTKPATSTWPTEFFATHSLFERLFPELISVYRRLRVSHNTRHFRRRWHDLFPQEEETQNCRQRN
jgi:hypothetical protein